jgi:3-hydroxyacyl-[acyl-carrier-protein] dehydratase
MGCYQDLKNSEISILKENDHRIRATFLFEKSLELFKGHFPGNPILPGIFQIEMVKYILEKSLHTTLCLQSVKKTKFSNLIHPDTIVKVEITINRVEKTFVDVKAIVRIKNVIAGKINLNLTQQNIK